MLPRPCLGRDSRDSRSSPAPGLPVLRAVADELRVWSEPVQFMVEPVRDGLIEFVLRRYETEQSSGSEDVEAAVLALEMIRDNEHGESWSSGVAMSALASLAERHGTEPQASEYPVLLSEGKLRGYWLIAPGVYQPPCGFAPADDGLACRLPRGHQGSHYMARERE